MGTDRAEGEEQWGRTQYHADKHAAGGIDELTDPRDYPRSATDPTTPAPADGDRYYNTSIKQWMSYDDSRSKWLSDAVFFVELTGGAGVAAGTFLDWGNQPTDAANGGVPALKGTIVSVAITRNDADAATIEVLRNGAAVTELASSATGITRDDAKDVDFDAGLLSVRVKAGSPAIDHSRVIVAYKRRI